VATDNCAGGSKAAERLAELLPGRARAIMIRYQTGSESTEQREAGFVKEMKRHPRIELRIAEDEAGATVATAQEAAERMLSNHADVEAIFAPNESSTQGVLQALRAKKLNGKMKLVGFDGSDILIAAMKSGDIQGLVLQDPFDMGYRAVLRAIDALEGKMPADPVHHTNLRVATPNNVDEPAVRAMYAPDLKSYLSP
jgi:ribose transport system substrate-binding protein